MGKNSHKKQHPFVDIFGLDTTPWIVSASQNSKKEQGSVAKIVVLGEQKSPEAHFKDLGIEYTDWIKDRFKSKSNEPLLMTSELGPTWYLAPSTIQSTTKDLGQFNGNSYSRFRDATSLATIGVLDYQLPTLVVEFIACSAEERAGALTGLEMGMYRFKTVRQGGFTPTSLHCLGASAEEISASGRLGLAVNIGRHLVNLPPFDLNPESFSNLARDLFTEEKDVTVTIIKGDALEKQRANLLYAVGRGAEAAPAIVHISYRPEKSKQKPLAFVGKGVTFDSGGLDIKDAASMRMMKKDMGGAGTTLALAWWVKEQKIGRPCDFYLALAENAIDKKSFHPGDVFKSRAGMTVEIDNTDAEGRLVLADVIDYALEQKDAPERIINFATLTGAMRIALGARISGMFANSDDLASELLLSARQAGEPAWRMPLYDDYFSQLKSTVADFANSGPNRFGAAITAALFLQKFVKDVPWAHFDIYCWTDAGVGGCQEIGGNGQCVQTISRFLLNCDGGATP